MEHLEFYVSEKTGRRYPIPVGKGYRRGCRCAECKRVNREKKRQERARRLAKGKDAIPEHVHGTWNGYSNWACRCMLCLQASRETTYAYAAEYREINRERRNARRRAYYREQKAKQLEEELNRKKGLQ